MSPRGDLAVLIFLVIAAGCALLIITELVTR